MSAFGQTGHWVDVAALTESDPYETSPVGCPYSSSLLPEYNQDDQSPHYHDRNSQGLPGEACVQKLAIAVAAFATLASTSVFAADMPLTAPPAIAWNWSGFYIGAGGSFNWSRFDQALQGVSGTINVFAGPVLVAQGQEGGPFFDFDRNESRFAPDVQLGYIAPFAGDWLAGLKFTYKYANIDSKKNVSIPQAGTLTTLVGPPTTIDITGFVQISPAEINLKHQLALMATIGRAFDKLTIYAGGGPALFRVETNFLNGIPFAVVGGQVFAVSGAPISLFNDNWVWGGVAQVGATYALAPRWFLDVAYTYARSANLTIENSARVTNQTGPLTTDGIGFLNTQERVTNQSVMLTLNRQF
jgi:opacity protein-like surface antigen